MDMNKLIGNGMTPMDLLPEDMKPIIERLLDGRFRSLLIIAEEDDGHFGDMFCLDMDGTVSNMYALLGALESVKRDLLDMIPSRLQCDEGREEDEDDD